MVLNNRSFSWAISALFPEWRYFLSKRVTIFLLKTDALFFILFSERTSQLRISSEKNEEILTWCRHEMLYWKCMSWICRFVNYLYCWIYSTYILHKKLNKILQESDWLFVLFCHLKSLYFICSHSFSFVVQLPVIRYHSLLSVITRCHSLSLDLSFVVTRCHSLSLDLSFVVTHCRYLSLFVPLVATRCTTCLSFYKQSNRSYVLSNKNPEIFDEVKVLQNQLKVLTENNREKYYLRISKSWRIS